VSRTKDVRGVTLAADPAREPCFDVVHTDAEMVEYHDFSDESRRERLHRHMNNECVAMEIAAQSVADGVAEAGHERADGEPLTVVLGLLDGLDGGALDDEHRGLLDLLRVPLGTERGGLTSSTARR